MTFRHWHSKECGQYHRASFSAFLSIIVISRYDMANMEKSHFCHSVNRSCVDHCSPKCPLLIYYCITGTLWSIYLVYLKTLGRKCLTVTSSYCVIHWKRNFWLLSVPTGKWYPDYIAWCIGLAKARHLLV